MYRPIVYTATDEMSQRQKKLTPSGEQQREIQNINTGRFRPLPNECVQSLICLNSRDGATQW